MCSFSTKCKKIVFASKLLWEIYEFLFLQLLLECTVLKHEKLQLDFVSSRPAKEHPNSGSCQAYQAIYEDPHSVHC